MLKENDTTDYLSGLRKHMEEVRKSNIEYKEYLKEKRSKLDEILNKNTKKNNNIDDNEDCVVVNLQDFRNARKTGQKI
jgi:hypothetical protein